MKNNAVASLEEQIGEMWGPYITSKIDVDYAESLASFLDKIYQIPGKTLPSREKVFRAFSYTKPAEIKVVLMGMDPYPNPGDADGLAFSSESASKRPASLNKISAELKRCYKYELPKQNCSLEKWAKQGVLLMNAALTVESSCPESHIKCWSQFANAVIETLLDRDNPPLFVLCGNQANKLLPESREPKTPKPIRTSHVVASKSKKYELFSGSFIFRRINEELARQSVEIDWKI